MFIRLSDDAVWSSCLSRGDLLLVQPQFLLMAEDQAGPAHLFAAQARLSLPRLTLRALARRGLAQLARLAHLALLALLFLLVVLALLSLAWLARLALPILLGNRPGQDHRQAQRQSQ